MKKNANNIRPSIPRQTAIIIAFATFAAGFLTGVGFTVYKTKPGSEIVSNQGQTISYAEQTATLEAEVLRNPQNTQAWVHLGHSYFDTDQYAKAISAYEKALELNPENADVWTDLGIMYRRSGQPGKAIENFDKAVVVDPKHETARFNKGIVLMHDLNDREGAIRAWEELLEINPLAMAGNNQSVDQWLRHYKEGHDR